MVAIEQELKFYILSKYETIKDFSRISGIPYTTIVGVINRGVKNSSAKTIHAIARALNLHVDQLLHGTVAPITSAVEDFAEVAPPTPENLAAVEGLRKAGKINWAKSIAAPMTGGASLESTVNISALGQTSDSIATDEARLLKLFRLLDEAGKQRAINFVIDLLK